MMGWRLENGPWAEYLADVRSADVMLTDIPFAGRVKDGARSNGREGQVIDYGAGSREDVRELVEWCTEVVDHWGVFICDHVSWRWLEEDFQARNWYTFAPLSWVKTNPTPRIQGDGPCSALEWIMVTRPRHVLPALRQGHRRGYYLGPRRASNSGPEPVTKVHGAKPLWLMRAILRDYALPGDSVIDPFAGSGTTLVAALEHGCHAMGAELDPATYAEARAWLTKPKQVSLL